MLADRDERTGELKKQEFGPWMLKAFGLLKHFRKFRGTALDPFGRTEERKLERKLIADYFTTIDGLLATLDAANHHIAVDIARVPEHIRGFGHVKERHLKQAKAREAELLASYSNPEPQRTAAE